MFHVLSFLWPFKGMQGSHSKLNVSGVFVKEQLRHAYVPLLGSATLSSGFLTRLRVHTLLRETSPALTACFHWDHLLATRLWAADARNYRALGRKQGYLCWFDEINCGSENLSPSFPAWYLQFGMATPHLRAVLLFMWCCNIWEIPRDT